MEVKLFLGLCGASRRATHPLIQVGATRSGATHPLRCDHHVVERNKCKHTRVRCAIETSLRRERVENRSVEKRPTFDGHLEFINTSPCTRGKIHMEPENKWVVEENSLPKVHFQVPC